MIRPVFPPHITPLELWDLPTPRGPLHTIHDPPFEVAAATAAVPTPRVFITGGRCEPLPNRPRHLIHRAPDGGGPFGAERGGLDLLRAHHHPTGLILDCGQTALKLTRVTPNGLKRHLIPRPPALLPALVRLISGPTVLALPAAVTPRRGRLPTLGPCSYDLPQDALAALDTATAGLPIYLLNDAVLAALTAQALLPSPPLRTLVLTLGFGLGAALWDPA